MNCVEVHLVDRALLSGVLHRRSFADTFVERDHSTGARNHIREELDALGSLESRRTSVNCTGSRGNGALVGDKKRGM